MEHHCEIIDEKEVMKLKANMLHMDDTEELAVFFKMYADPTRLKILNLLFQSELCVCDIAYLLGMSHSATSHQLAVLKRNRIIKSRREKKNVFYSLDDRHIEMIYNAAFEHIKE
ncbi:DNA-binding transcriptional ArsR family regulator [Breznakia sp. PF5-3]|uniref:ArsR/SmtB family transcription factor n=1 Tax=unclassified Breznakia TaxID=2623764 RepID=UPI002405267A|nr:MULTISPECIES: metalloregulator ArsR/SmtB family transcription factor [unclassified Breznakia]MDF9823751.1 DNA-binding transcriptional ArsR family regulator [Breznakia sp. PM6-1]MDF9834549.1 DNA-binding transcriptional ArsR family regulator [Breznakia sp. PF5-3]MDF9838258.1 DNA-binding transcriptional ArsR family regulator [Breznakia sp. PFB2-8]MDF9860274.1 DNA-binding transcriptional ArsR family regulator [Breznakia sp. PH5-24]